MGQSLTVFLVPRAKLVRVSENDPDLREELHDMIEEKLAALDEETGAPDPSLAADLSHAAALDEVFAGVFTPGVPLARYASAFKCACDWMGYEEDGGLFEGRGLQWYARLDEVMAAAGLSARLTALVTDPPPVPMPRSPDRLLVGHWPEALAAEAEAVDQLLDGFDTDDERWDAINSAQWWLGRMAKAPGEVLIGFLTE